MTTIFIYKKLVKLDKTNFDVMKCSYNNKVFDITFTKDLKLKLDSEMKGRGLTFPLTMALANNDYFITQKKGKDNKVYYRVVVKSYQAINQAEYKESKTIDDILNEA